jgi:hypothetical protein
MRTYVGPYVECSIHNIEVDAQMRSCTRDTCSQFEKEVHDPKRKFCPQCGSPIGTVMYKTKEKNVKGHWLVEEINEDLSLITNDTFFQTLHEDDNLDIWIANKKFCNRNCWLDGESYVGELTIDDIVREKDQFRQTFAKALKVFSEKYGDGKCVVKWGVVHHWG